MSYAPLNNRKAPDRYDNDAMVIAPGAVRFDVDVANAAIAYKFGTYNAAIEWWEEVFLAPGFRSFDRRADVIAVRAWVPEAGLPPGAIQAQVTIVALTAAEVTGAMPPNA